MDVQKKKIGERIGFERNSNQTLISISQRVKPWQEAVIFTWVGLWVICGFFFVSQYFISDNEQQKIFIIIFLGFWSYLLFKALQIMCWRLVGTEDILISKGELHYKRSFAGLGRKQSYTLYEIKNLGLIKYKEKSFKQSYESYFWSMGAESIGFNAEKKYVLLGMQLEPADARLLNQLIADSIKKMK